MLIAADRRQRCLPCTNVDGREPEAAPFSSMNSTPANCKGELYGVTTCHLRPIVKPARKSRYTLEELLSGMTRDNVPQEVDWGPRRGNEAW